MALIHIKPYRIVFRVAPIDIEWRCMSDDGYVASRTDELRRICAESPNGSVARRFLTLDDGGNRSSGPKIAIAKGSGWELTSLVLRESTPEQTIAAFQDFFMPHGWHVEQ